MAKNATRAGSSSKRKETIGFIGLGLMGRAFSGNLLQDGHTLVGTDPSKTAQAKLRQMGGKPLASPREVAEAADIVFISVPNSRISLSCAKGKDGYLACDHQRKPNAVVDTTTADPEDTRTQAKLCQDAGFDFLEACVSGHSENVRDRKGLFLIGGDEKLQRRLKSLLGRMLSDQIHCGPPGMGATMKIVINYLASLERCAIAEALRLGLRSGFKGELLLDTLQRSAVDSRQLRTRGPRMIGRKFSHPVSSLDVIAKDIKLGMRLAARTDSLVPLGKVCLPIFNEGKKSGYGSLDSAAIYKVFEDREKRRKRDPRWH